jgi:DNA-binding CsgD family transcriptional regulator
MSPYSAGTAASRSELIEQIVQAVHGGEGHAGVLRAGRAEGRTTTLRRLREASAVGQVQARSARCAAVESARPYTLLRSLLTEFGCCANDLEGTSLPPALAGLDEGSDPGEIGEAAWRLLCSSARHDPVLLLVDDVHLADAASAAVLGHLAERVAGSAAGVVMTAPADAAVHPALERLPAVWLPGLQGPDLVPLLGARAGLITPTVTDELITLCHGHPLLLHDMLGVLTDDQLRGKVPLPRRPSLGPGALRVFTQPCRVLPEPTRRWLLVLALGNADPAVCVRAARRLGLDLDELVPAEAAGIVRISGTDMVRWSSPLTRTAMAQAASLADLTRTYRALAEATTPATAPVDHSRWLIRSLPEAGTDPEVLRTATIAMVRGGGLLDAYELALEAASHTTDVEQHLRWRITAAELCLLSGYPEHSLSLLGEVSAASPKGETALTASALSCVIHGLRYSWQNPASSPLLAGLSDHTHSARQQSRALGTALLAGWETAPPAALAGIISQLERTYQDTDEPLPATARAIGKVLSGHSDPRPEERDALRAVAWWVDQDDPLHSKAWPPPLLPVFIGEEDAYAQQFTTLLATAHAHAAHSTRALLLLKLATAQAALGHWAHALRNATDSAALAADLGLRAVHSDALELSALLAAARGDQAGYRHQLAGVYQQEGRRAAGRQPPMMQWAQGLLALSAGRPGEAYERLRQLHEGAVGCPQHHVLRRLSTVDLIEAAVQAQQPDDAASLTEEFAAWVAEGAAPWAHLDLARCRALLDDTDAEQWYLHALEYTPVVGRLATTARTELSFGTWLQRHKRHREARGHLRLAEQYFTRLAAPAWHDRAHAELRAAGETDPQSTAVVADLTPQELRIARLAALGKTNGQIAEALTLSPRTVGYHLYKIFPKLNITSRTQLPTALEELGHHPRATSRWSRTSPIWTTPPSDGS